MTCVKHHICHVIVSATPGIRSSKKDTNGLKISNMISAFRSVSQRITFSQFVTPFVNDCVFEIVVQIGISYENRPNNCYKRSKILQSVC